MPDIDVRVDRLEVNYTKLIDRLSKVEDKSAGAVKGLLGHESLKTTYKYIKPTQKAAMHTYARAQNW